MNINSFLQCLTLNGIVTGNAIQGIYTFNSGDSNLIYNNLYPTGAMYYSGLVSAINTPLINVGTPITNSTFSGGNIFRIGHTRSGDFGLLLDVQYNACRKPNLIDYCLLSSNTLNNSGKNFVLGINDANRIYLKTSGNYFYTLPQELTSHDLVYFSLNQHQYINLGIFNVQTNTFFNKNIDLGQQLNSDVVYIGGEFNNQTTTGFSGIMSNAVLFSQPVFNMNNCVSCYFVTGYSINNNTATVQIPQITGFTYSGIQNSITYTGLNSGSISKVNGSNLNVEYVSSITSGITSGLLAVPLYGSTGISVSQPYYTFYKNTGIINSYNAVTINFTSPLLAGDVLEAYSYYYPIPNVGTQLLGYDVSNVDGIMQIMSNGLAETINVDYQIVRNQVSGFYPGDILNYDILNSQSVVVYFSGGFDNVFTGSMANTILNVTGVSGVCYGNTNYPNFGYDVFLNGQKLISGYEYSVFNTGTSGFYVSISGFELWTVGGTGINYSEIGFIPQFNNFIYVLSGVTQTTPVFSGISGFSEQIWVNGIRQIEGVDYITVSPCSTQSGAFYLGNLPFNFYNNDNTWNFQYPPVPQNISGQLLAPGLLRVGRFSWSPINLNGYESGNYIEFYGQINGSGYNKIGTTSTSATSYNWLFGYLPSGIPTGLYCGKVRYVNNTIVGEMSDVYCITF